MRIFCFCCLFFHSVCAFRNPFCFSETKKIEKKLPLSDIQTTETTAKEVGCIDDMTHQLIRASEHELLLKNKGGQLHTVCLPCKQNEN